MKLSKIAALFMVPVLALCLVACSAPGGNASESASSDPKIAELTAQKPANADEAAELYAKLMQKENEIFSSDNALWNKVFLSANKNSTMIEDGTNYGDFLLATIESAKDGFSADELKTLKAGAEQIKEIEDKLESLEKEFPGCGSTPSAGESVDASTAGMTAGANASSEATKFPSFTGKDLDGNDVNSDELFSKNKVTVMNFWFTTCKPCVGELGDLEKLNQELAEKGGQVVGVNSFTLDGNKGEIADAKDVLSKKGVTYKNIWFKSDSEAGKFTSNLFSFPTTYVIDQNGNIVDEWRLWEILDPYRDTAIKALAQGAVCLNIDASKAGQTLSAEELAKQEASDVFGDIPGVGPGRNWAHVNSVDYDPTDDSIIISSRHQSAIVKIGRDKKVKWILASPEGWKGELAKKVLTPVDKNGNKIKCEGSVCEGGFDWTWTQHTAWRVDAKSTKDVIYVSAFDNGDARGMEQPALPSEKYTRGVMYKIDQNKMTVEQVWEVGKEAGHEYYSPVTGLTKYMADKDSFVVYYSTSGLSGPSGGMKGPIKPHPYLAEYKFGETDPSVLIRFQDTMGYQAWAFDLKKAFPGSTK